MATYLCIFIFILSYLIYSFLLVPLRESYLSSKIQFKCPIHYSAFLVPSYKIRCPLESQDNYVLYNYWHMNYFSLLPKEVSGTQ